MAIAPPYWRTAMPDFALVLVNYRSADQAIDAVRAVRADTPSEVVVVDNASGDGSPQRLREALPEAAVVERAANDGFAAGVNAGFAATTAPFVVLLNPDTRPRPGAVRRLVDHLAGSHAAGVAAPRLLHEDGTPQPNAYRRPPGLWTLFAELSVPLAVLGDLVPALDRYRTPPGEYWDGARVAHATGAALAVRTIAYEAAGPLDEGFFLYLEETEWQGRVRAAGFAIELVPSAEVVHLVRGGDHADLAPSPHFVASARRYLRTTGHSRAAVEATLTLALLSSRAGARAWERAPGARHTGGARAAAWDEVWRRRRAAR